jgi:hypothetical protein
VGFVCEMTWRKGHAGIETGLLLTTLYFGILYTERPINDPCLVSKSLVRALPPGLFSCQIRVNCFPPNPLVARPLWPLLSTCSGKQQAAECRHMTFDLV